MAQHSFGFVVVGNGAIGSFIARELARRGSGTLAICGDPERQGGASQAAGAMLGCFAEVTAEALRTPVGSHKFELALAARNRWPAELNELRCYASDHGLNVQTTDDTYVVLNSRSGELDTDNFEAIIRAAQAHDEPWEEVPPDKIPGYAPRSDSRGLRAMTLPNEGAVDARAVLEVLARQIDEAGVARFGRVRSVLTANGQACGVLLDDGSRVEAGTVIVATGAWGESLVDTAIEHNNLVPTLAGLGFSATSLRARGPGFTSVIRTPNRAFACGLHLVPLGGGYEYLGATNMVVSEARNHPIIGDIHFLLDCAMRQLSEDIYHSHITDFRVGNRPVTIDGLPLVGWTSCEGLYLVTGTYRDGFHSAPLLAEHIVAELAGKEGILGDVYTPGRALVLGRSVEQSIDDFVQHRLAAWFETGAQAPPNMPTYELRRTLRDQAAMFYDSFGLEVGLPPDILMYVLGTLRSPKTAAILKYLKGSTRKAGI